MARAFFDPFVYLSIAGAVAGLVPALLLQRIARSRRPVRVRALRRVIVPLAATLGVVALSVALFFGLHEIIDWWRWSIGVFLAPFLVVWIVARVRWRAGIVAFVVCAPILAFGAIRGVPNGLDTQFADPLGHLVIDGDDERETVLVLAIDRDDDRFVITAKPAGVPLRERDETVDLDVALSGSVVIEATIVRRAPPLWIAGPRSLLVGFTLHRYNGSSGGRPSVHFERERAFHRSIGRVESFLGPILFRSEVIEIPFPVSPDEYLQEGEIPIAIRV